MYIMFVSLLINTYTRKRIWLH